ncbi:MAG: hypothetical protein QW035_00715 [Candidatus Anstonellales archaeon]
MDFAYSTRKSREKEYPLLFAYSRCISPYFGKSFIDAGLKDWIGRRAELKEFDRFKVEADRCGHKCYGALYTGSRALAREAYEQALFGERAALIYSNFSPSFLEVLESFKKIKEEIGATFYGPDLVAISRYETLLFNISYRKLFTFKEFLASLSINDLAFQRIIDLKSPLFASSQERSIMPNTSFDWCSIILECDKLRREVDYYIEHKKAMRLGMASWAAMSISFSVFALATFSWLPSAAFTLPFSIYISSLSESFIDPKGVLRKMLFEMEVSSKAALLSS